MTPRRWVTLVRAPLWWTPKILPVIAAASLGAITAGVPGGDGTARVLAMVVSAVGVAAFAHVVNDLADRDADRRAGKRNAVTGAGTATAVAVLVGSAAVSVLPWLVVPIGVPAAATLVALVVTSIVYSCPPLRLKQRGGVGVVADAAVAHVLPTVVAFTLMGSAGDTTAVWWMALASAVAWSAGFGVRNIVVHQLLDEDGDRQAGVDTFVVRRGPRRATRAGRDAFGLEVLGLVGLALVTLWVAWGVALFFAVHAALWLHHRRWEHPSIDTVPTRPGQWLPLAEFYEVWPAVAFTVALTVGDLAWGWQLLGIVVVFWPAVEKQALDQLAMVAEVAVVVGERVAVAAAWAAGVTGDISNRGYHRVRIALRETRFAIVRAWWALYRWHWRVRHWFGPLVLFVRRQRRRLRRLLRGEHRRSA